MSEYKIGDKVYLECEVIGRDAFDNTYKLNYENHMGSCTETHWTNGCKLHTLDEVDESYNKGLNDAWELAKKIILPSHMGGYTMDEFKNIFGKNTYISALRDFTPQEALAKAKAYEECNEIKKGDVVRLKGCCIESIVTRVSGDIIYQLFRDGSCGSTSAKEDYKKTGEHFDSIDEFVRSADD